MTLYDAITNQFNPQLSPLARRMYQAIFEIVCNPEKAPCLNTWPVDEAGERARKELIHCGLIETMHAGVFLRYRLTSAAWRAHLLHQQMLYDLAVRGLEGTERALDAALKEDV
jgi:hypothetical protein